MVPSRGSLTSQKLYQCHIVNQQDATECMAEGAAAEGATAEGAIAEGAIAEGATAEGATAEGAAAEGSKYFCARLPYSAAATSPKYFAISRALSLS